MTSSLFYFHVFWCCNYFFQTLFWYFSQAEERGWALCTFSPSTSQAGFQGSERESVSDVTTLPPDLQQPCSCRSPSPDCVTHLFLLASLAMQYLYMPKLVFVCLSALSESLHKVYFCVLATWISRIIDSKIVGFKMYQRTRDAPHSAYMYHWKIRRWETETGGFCIF